MTAQSYKHFLHCSYMHTLVFLWSTPENRWTFPVNLKLGFLCTFVLSDFDSFGDQIASLHFRVGFWNLSTPLLVINLNGRAGANPHTDGCPVNHGLTKSLYNKHGKQSLLKVLKNLRLCMKYSMVSEREEKLRRNREHNKYKRELYRDGAY